MLYFYLSLSIKLKSKINKQMKRSLFVLLSVLTSSLIFGQQELKKNQFEGYVVLKNGDRKEGIIEIKNVDHPWSFQEAFKFFDKSLLENDKIKKDDKKEYKPGDVIEYGYGGKRYGLVSYTNNNQAEGNALTSGMSALKNATQTKHFAEVYREGKVSLYRFYNSPPDFYVTSGNDEAQKMDDFIRDCKTNYDILIEKGEEKAKSFDDINVGKFFKDCDFVVKKYKNKEYTKKPVTGLKSMVKAGLLRGEPLAAAALEMIVDYEANCIK